MERAPGGHAEGLRRRRGGTAGAESGSSSVKRTTVNTGTVPDLACRHVSSVDGWAGFTVDRSVRDGAESPWYSEPGKARCMGRATADGVGMVAVMPGDAPPNGGAPAEVPKGPWQRVPEMQSKFHRWAAAGPGRRFGDVFDFVHDPATLMVAFAGSRATGARARPASTV